VARWSVLGTRTIRRRWGRFGLTAAGVALGVGVLFAILITNSTIDAGLDRMLNTTTDTPRVQIQPAGGYAAAVPVAAIRAAAKLPSVIDVNGSIGFAVDVKGLEPTTVYVSGGVVERGASKPPKGTAGDFDVAGREPADGAAEVGLSGGLANALHLRIGSSFEFDGPKGPAHLTVTSIATRRRGDRSERFAWTSFDTAGSFTDRPGLVNEGSIRLAKGTDVGTWLAAHQAALGPTIRLTTNGIDAKAIRDALGAGKAALAGLAGVALFVSAFLIFLTLSMSVTEAVALHGTLRALGASRAQVRRTVLSDAVALVMLATPVGLALGVVFAFATVRLTRTVYGLPDLGTTVRPLSALVALAVGVVVALLSAVVPARRAAPVPPAVAIRAGHAERAGTSRLWMLGVGLLAAGPVVVLISRQKRVDLGSMLILGGAVLVVPVLMTPIGAIAARLTRRMAGGVGAVGVLHLRREPRRSAYTLALVMVVLAMVFAAGAVHLSLRRNMADTIAQRFPADIAIYPLAGFGPDTEAKVAATPGVRATARVWYTRATEVSPVAGDADITAVDPATFFAVQTVSWSRGSDRSVAAALRHGGAVAIPDSLAAQTHVRMGDAITLATPMGNRAFRVAGVYRTFQSIAPLFIGIDDGRRNFIMDNPSLVAVAVAPGHDPATVREAILRGFGAGSPGFIQLTSRQKADFIEGQTRFFNLVYAIVMIAVVMGTLGVTNTLTMAIIRRTREIGILRAVGTERKLLRRMALVESATIGLAGLVLAVPLGVALSFTVLQTTTRSLGIVVRYVFPWPMFAVVGPLAVVVGMVSAVVPGRHAARVDPARVLRFD
jgi:putative ABC transport system permease protein